MTTRSHLAPFSRFAPGVIGNRDLRLVPQASPGARTVAFDFPGVEVGTAEYAEGPTGCTVVHVPAGARTFTDARGGAVGMSGGYDRNHAICLTGGSVYGLSAVAGVGAELLERQQNCTRWDVLQCVSGAVIYDYSARDNAITPDEELGRAALRHARTDRIAVGRAGAGASATVGKVDYVRAEFAGQGAAFRQYGQIRMLFVTVLNAVGVIVDREGRVVRGNLWGESLERRHPLTDYENGINGANLAPVHGNTTISVLVTNVKLSDYSLRQLGLQVHSSMHRGIQPFHTESDGDTLFTLTTDEVDLTGISTAGFGTLASDTAWDAILAALD
ncbi:P1 family peptidase [Acrocarpospora macrocephala]|uniref:Peptidase S58 n=1 Tax=Acrocarpospora macrocephala TaxID=150177 RepID=A0A5M3WPF1_9ACTN|nr:P1 family peptidase [Acrocarpospora macrocephala]GES09111.1 peptidase S58 [Acrocarpospora macrocephala]